MRENEGCKRSLYITAPIVMNLYDFIIDNEHSAWRDLFTFHENLIIIESEI